MTMIIEVWNWPAPNGHEVYQVQRGMAPPAGTQRAAPMNKPELEQLLGKTQFQPR